MSFFKKYAFRNGPGSIGESARVIANDFNMFREVEPEDLMLSNEEVFAKMYEHRRSLNILFPENGDLTQALSFKEVRSTISSLSANEYNNLSLFILQILYCSSLDFRFHISMLDDSDLRMILEVLFEETNKTAAIKQYLDKSSFVRLSSRLLVSWSESNIYEKIANAGSKTFDASENEESNKASSSNEVAFIDVSIGNQIWMTKNLDVSTFRNGDPIPQAQTDEEWKKAGLSQQPAWCYHNNDSANGTKYGKLYNWYAVNDPRGLAPSGYHIPSDSEWIMLTDCLGGDLIAGKKMKSTSGWKEQGNGNNESGFSGLPDGYRFPIGSFDSVGKSGYWWSSTEDDPYAKLRSLNYLDEGCDRIGHEMKSFGFSVRCLRDGSYRESSSNKVASSIEFSIGNQIWMKSNLDVNTFRNGDPIPQAQTYEEWEKAGLSQQPAWCYYNNDSANGMKFGKLYNWYAVNDPRGLAPKGYHIPSNSEWTALINSLGGCEAAGKKMKSTDGWKRNGNGTNESGLSFLPGGFRSLTGTFFSILISGSWWSSTEADSKRAWDYIVNNFDDEVVKNSDSGKNYGHSVRCVRD